MDRRLLTPVKIAEVAGVGFLLLAATGCTLPFPSARNEFGTALPQNASVEEIVGRLNTNIERVQSWQSYDVTISGSSLPVHLNGKIVVERPRKFRLIASALGSDEADFGSNGDRFWFWVKRAQQAGQQNYVYQARYEDVEQSDLFRQMPFQPDWLLEALGIVPIDAKQFTLHPEDSHHVVNLVSDEQLTPAGKGVKKVIRVDKNRAVILGYSLYDATNKLIAKTQFDNHHIDAAKRIMPHRIMLDWPQAGVKITLEMGHIEINPSTIPRRIWEVPNKQPYYPPYDLGALVPKRNDRAHASAAGHTKQKTGGAGPVVDEQSAFSDTQPARTAATRSSANAESPPDWEKPIEPVGAVRVEGNRGISSVRDAGDRFEPASQPRQSKPPASAANRDPFAFDDAPAEPRPAERGPAEGGSDPASDPIETAPR
jgi:outer membrane lipoprotein-sorting protein